MTDWSARHSISSLNMEINRLKLEKAALENLTKALAGVITLHLPQAAVTIPQLLENFEREKKHLPKPYDPDEDNDYYDEVDAEWDGD